MPIYTVQGPDGKTYDVQGPEGATADQLGQFITAVTKPSIFKDSARGARPGAFDDLIPDNTKPGPFDDLIPSRLSRAESALVKADAAGDTEGARILAGEVRRLRSSGQAAPSIFDKAKGFIDTARQGIGDAEKNLAAGALRGAGSIGSTLLAPADYLGEQVAKVVPAWLKPELSNPNRRKELDLGLQAMGADPSSLAYQGGKLVAEVAGTAGAGGAVANGIRAIPAISRVAPNLAAAVESGGFNLGAAPSTGIVGRAADLATRIGGGATLGAASAGLIDPETTGMGAALGGALPGAAKLAGAISNGVGNVIKGTIGTTTGVGGEAINTAIQSGKDGAGAFLDNLRGNVPFTDVLQQAKDALTKMRLDRGAEYRNGMAQVSGDKTVLDMAPIQAAINGIQSLGSYKGQAINKNAAGTVQELADQVANWAKLDPAEFHTPEGLDALKKSIGDIRDLAQFGTPARKAADTAYNAIKDQITAQAPIYAKTMQGYGQASDLISEIERALSLGNKASADTSMRKLQSLMRNNVSTNYGNRLDLANELQDKGGQNILPAVAGQAMNSWTPRGMTGAIEKAGGLLGLIMHPAAALPLAAVAPVASPRIMGEAAYKYGQAVSPLSNALNKLSGGQVPASLTGGGSVLANRLSQLLLQPQPRLARE